jgi:serine/threonine protein kinase/Flp pilus assembly protein TadD
VATKCPKCQAENPETKQFCADCGTQLLPSKDIHPEVTETLQAPARELTTGSTFAGRYQIIEELGKGGMAKVYKVFDTEINEKVALKLLKSEISAQEKTIERFRNELKFARKIIHKNVCRMYDLGREQDTFYITMEYISGEDLKNMIRMMGQLNIEKAISIVKQVCEGLAEAHRLGVVHRDLKPQNIMIDRDGNARIMDFGIARSLKAKGITGEGTIIGTPEYMSPEQVEGSEADHRSDIYSLGVIFYEMVTGRVPFEGDTPFSIAIKHKAEAPPNPRRFNERIPEDIIRVILRCMEKSKEKRYQTAGQLLSELSMLDKEKYVPGKTDDMKEGSSIAVLPFADLSPGKDQEYFCDGIAEELINALTKIEKLKVASGSSAFQFKGKGHDIHEIGEKLKVKTVLEGSVRKAGNRLRIAAQLVNVADGYHLWAEKYECEMEDIFAIQDEISLAIVEKLKVKLLKEEKERLIKRHTKDVEAYNLYLKGRYFWNKRTKEGFRRAVQYFEQAIAEDPSFSLAYSGLADTHNLLGFYCLLAPSETFPKAKAASLRALEIDATIAEAYASLGFANLYYDWNWQEARKNLTKAIELGPGYPTAHHWYAEYLVVMGRMEEALSEARQALEFDPFSLIMNVLLGWVFYYSGRFDQALDQFQKTLDMDPDFSPAHFFLGLTHVQNALFEEALEEFHRAKALFGDCPLMDTAIGHAYALWGKSDEMKKSLEELEKMSLRMYIPSYFVAATYADKGDKDQALSWLAKCYKERDMWFVFLKVDPIWHSLRSDPRFKALLKKVNLE